MAAHSSNVFELTLRISALRHGTRSGYARKELEVRLMLCLSATLRVCFGRAANLTQDFFASLLRKDYLARADPLKGGSARSCSMPSKRGRRVEVRYLNLMLTLVRRLSDFKVAS